MVSQNLDQVLTAAQALTSEEREELRRLLNERAALASAHEREHSHRSQERRRLAEKLTENDIRLTIPPEPTPDELARFNAWRPIELPGGPLSDDIVRDRR